MHQVYIPYSLYYPAIIPLSFPHSICMLSFFTNYIFIYHFFPFPNLPFILIIVLENSLYTLTMHCERESRWLALINCFKQPILTISVSFFVIYFSLHRQMSKASPLQGSCYNPSQWWEVWHSLLAHGIRWT